MQKVYIAGKITGDQNYWGKFSRAEDLLESEGFIVINPATLPGGMTSADYMRICISMIDTADIVAFLPDWEESRGAKLEWQFCQYVEKQTMYLSQMSFYTGKDN